LAIGQLQIVLQAVIDGTLPDQSQACIGNHFRQLFAL